MDPGTPMVLAAASYASRDDAVEAFKIGWGARHQGEFDHMDVTAAPAGGSCFGASRRR